MAKTSWKVKDRYNKAHYVRFSMQIDRAVGEPFKALCDKQGLSYSKVLSDYMIEYMRFWRAYPPDNEGSSNL